MYAIDNNTASTTLPPPKPVGIPGFFTTGTVGGVPATIVEADWLNQVQAELLAILGAASITPSKATNNQVLQAIMWLIANNTRQRLTAPLSLYVNAATGSDTNNGLSPTTAFATPQAAWNFIMQRLDVGGQSITVHMADGSYPPLRCEGSPVGAGTAGVTFFGDDVSPTSCVISNAIGTAVAVIGGAIVTLRGVHLQAAGSNQIYSESGSGLSCVGGLAIVNNVDFGTCSYAHMLAQAGGQIVTYGTPYSISSNASFHMLANGGGTISIVASPVTLYNSPTFSQAFVEAWALGYVGAYQAVFNGAAHGKRYFCQANGVVACGVNPDTFFPGDVAGTVQSGGFVL
jgi:hypothetical protein